MRATLRFSAIVAIVLLLAPSSAHAVKKCPTLEEILDQYVSTESPRGIKEWAQRMVQLMKSRAKWDGFMKASAKEFSTENVYFLVAVDTYQQDFGLLKPTEQLDLANAIYDRFIGPQAVNVAGTISKSLKQWKATRPQAATKDTFKRAYIDVMDNAVDTHSRFVVDVQENGLGKDLSYKNCK